MASDLSRMRNIGIVAHIDAGKTTVTERILFYTGVEHRMGEVHEGTTVMDWMDEERKRGITIQAAATTVPWQGNTINIIDTPGHVDFTVEVERSMRVLDGAVLVLNGVAGVQAQSETVWRQMRRHEVPALLFVNQCDRAGADFFASVKSVRDRLGARAVPVQYPVGTERGLRSVVDLVANVLWTFPEEDQARNPVRGGVPAELADEVAVLRAELLEVLAESDEEVLAAVVEEREPDPARVLAALRAQTVAGQIVPALCGAALRNVGVQPLVDAVVDWLPSPLDRPPVVGVEPKSGERIERPPDPDAPTCAMAFKLVADAHEDLTFVRIYSGAIEPGAKLWNPRTRRMERVSRVLRMHAETRNAVEIARAGEIVALTGCRETATGDTLCDRSDPILLGRLEFPEPVMTKVVEPMATVDRDRLRAALTRLEYEDPTFRVREDEETGQWLIAGMGELHLEILQHRLESDFRLKVKVGKPRVAYRERVRGEGRGHSKVDRVVAGKQVFGEIDLVVSPGEEGAPPAVRWADDCPVPASFRGAVDEALVSAANVGPRFGFPLVGTTIRVVGGADHPARAAEVGYVQAAVQALRSALNEAPVELLEPVMAFEILTPAEFASGIIADLNASGASLSEIGAESGERTLTGEVPLARMFGYSTALRSLSQGRASCSLQPAGFRPVPEAELAERGLVWT